MGSRTADASKYPKTPVLRYEDDVAILPNEYFDEIVYRLDNCGYRVGELDGWYPTMRQAEELAKNAVDHYEFIFWITESNYGFYTDPPIKRVSEVIQITLQNEVNRLAKSVISVLKILYNSYYGSNSV